MVDPGEFLGGALKLACWGLEAARDNGQGTWVKRKKRTNFRTNLGSYMELIRYF